MVVRVKRVHERNVRAHDVLAVLAEQWRQQTEAVERHVRGMERSKQRQIGQVAEQVYLSKNGETLLDLVRPAAALALRICLLEEITAAHVEDVVADGGAEAFVLWAGLVCEACVEG